MPSDGLMGVKEFQECRYEHNCTIDERKRDVLESDVPGDRLTSKVRRWWHGLFLVSYGDERCGAYYTSSEALRVDRIRHFRHYRGRIHPFSKFRNFWDALMLILFIINKILVHHNTSVVYGQVSRCFYFMGPVIEIIIMIDVVVNSKTGHIDRATDTVILEKYEGVLRYCSSRLSLHVASAIPIQWIMLLRYGGRLDCDLCKTNYFIFTVRAIAVFGLFRIYECSSYFTREWDSFELTCAFRFARVFILGLLTVLFFNDISLKVALVIMINDGRIDEDSRVSQLLYNRFVVSEPAPSHTLFVLSIMHATKCTMHVNIDTVDYYIDRCVTITSIILVSLFQLWCFHELFAYASGIYFSEDRRCKLKSNTHSMVRCRRLPDNITKNIYRFHTFKNAENKVIQNRNNYLVTLPLLLKRDIFLASYTRHVETVPYFSKWPARVIEEIALLFREEFYLENDIVAEPWVASEGLVVVAVGELAVYSGAGARGEERGHLTEGDSFGELSLVTDEEMRTSTVAAITPCVVLLLEKMLFRKYMRQYPDLFMELKYHVCR